VEAAAGAAESSEDTRIPGAVFRTRSTRYVMRVVRAWTALAIIAANLVGTAIVFVLLVWAIPTDPNHADHYALLNLIFAGAYLLIAVPIGIAWSLRRLRPSRRWMTENREPTEEEQLNLLRSPLHVCLVVAILWFIAALLFGGFNATYSFELGRKVFITLILGGLATCAIAYLLTERLTRPLAVRALRSKPLEDPALPGVTARTIFAWALGSAVPMLGLMIVGISTLADDELTRTQLAVAVLALTGTGLIVGFLCMFIAARAIAAPVISVRHAVSDVGEGDLDVEVPVYDGSELGLLQSGFNQMVTGLRERERIRDVFGRHVGEDVAREALEREGSLGGETREVAILFIDMVGSTELASSRPATEVVELLNAFFGIVVETVHEHNGWVNKFEGDAALAVFGAPQEIDDPCGSALAAARGMAERLSSEVDDVRAGIGVSWGEVVAGNIGGAERFEYTVIGDAVNEAARLMDLAKEREVPVLASSAAVEAAAGDESANWELGDEVELRGRAQATRVAEPSGATGSGA
jgi:adenylate cyclase